VEVTAEVMSSSIQMVSRLQVDRKMIPKTVDNYYSKQDLLIAIQDLGWLDAFHYKKSGDDFYKGIDYVLATYYYTKCLELLDGAPMDYLQKNSVSRPVPIELLACGCLEILIQLCQIAAL
jgi:hypothetical protein